MSIEPRGALLRTLTYGWQGYTQFQLRSARTAFTINNPRSSLNLGPAALIIWCPIRLRGICDSRSYQLQCRATFRGHASRLSFHSTAWIGRPTDSDNVTLRQNIKSDGIERDTSLQYDAGRSQHKATMAARLGQLTDQLLKTLNDISHRLNIYTGTDYTPIGKLRALIAEQESHVKSSRKNVDVAKGAHHQTVTTQAASQKEVVQLLERKHSWSAPDLERYMSLIRSEHVNEKAVQESRDHVKDAERQLEQARQGLEKMERRQYHEEQILSDTIRRNSTWITFALMGLNVVLLVSNLLVFEPLRRKKIVREMRVALDEKVTLLAASQNANEPGHMPTHALELQDPGKVLATSTTAAPVDAHTSLPAVALKAPESDAEAPVAKSQETVSANSSPILANAKAYLNALALQTPSLVTDPFSQESVMLRKIDLTTAAVEGIAVGTAATLCIVWLFGGMTR